MWKNTQRSWVGGRLDAELAGRQDLSRYFQGAGEILNFTVRRQGLLSKRGGTTLVAALPDHEDTGRKTLNHGAATLSSVAPWDGKVAHARLVALSAETDEGYYVLLTDIAEQGDGRARIVTADGGLVGREIEVPWDGEDFAELVFTQSGDTLIVTHMAYRPSRLVRTGTDLSFSYLPIGEATTTPPKITGVGKSNVDGGDKDTATERYVYYKATAVADGIESEPSAASSISYLPPWKDGGTITVKVGPNENETVPEYYNVYKKSGGSDYGYIGRAETVDATLAAAAVSSVGDATWLAQYGSGTATKTVASAWIMTALPATCGWKKSKGSAYNGWAAASGEDTIEATLAAKSTIRSVTVGLGTVVTTVPTQSSDLGSDSKYEWTYSVVFVPFLNETVTLTLDGADAATVAVPAEAREWREEIRSIRSAKIPTAATVNSDAADAVEAFASACKVTVKVAPTAATTIGIKAGIGTVTVASTYGDVRISGSPPVIHGIVVTTGSETATFTDDYITPDLTTTFHDRGVTPFTQVGDYPAACAFYQQRLCLAGTESDPARLRMSATGDLWEFDPHVSVREDDALDAELAATEFPRINHLLFFRDLLAFTDGGTWLIAPVSGNAISYKTFSAKRQSAIGCDRGVPPMVVGDEVLFVKAGGQSVISTRYSYSEDGYSINDLTVLSQWMFKENRIVSAAYRQEPDSWIYCVLADGTVAVLVYMKEQELCAWTRMTLGGGWMARGAASSRAIKRSTSEMLMLVQDADGAFELWRMDDDVKAGDAPRAEDFLCLDRKRVLADGEEAADGETVVDCGSGKRIAGLAYEARMTTMRPEPQGANATIQFEVRNAKDAEVRVLDSGTFTIRAVGVPESLAVDAGIETKVGADGTVGLATADVRRVLAGRSGADGRVEIKSTTPWPLNVLSLSVDYEIQTLSGSEG